MVGRREGDAEREQETEDERAARHEAEAAGLFRSVVAEATGDQVGVAHFVMDCFDLLGAAPDDHDDSYSDSDSDSSSSALVAGQM